MYFSVPQRRLWWKESRQLIPLVVMLPPTLFGIMLLILLPTMLVSPAAKLTDMLSAAVPLLLGIPLLFSVGVGGLLVGMEKENRTLDWLSSLPVARRHLVWTKLAVGLFWLGILWCICLPIGYAIRFRFIAFGAFGQSEFAGLFGVVPYIVYSVFLTLAGLAVAWRARSAWLSVVWLIPVAVFVLIVLGFIADIGDRAQLASDSSLVWRQSAILLAFSLLAGWLAVREGYRALAPCPALSPSAAGTAHLSLASPTSNYHRAGYRALTSPMPALLWQFARQGRGVLVGLAAIMIAGAAMNIWTLRQLSLGLLDGSTDQQRMIRSAFTSPLAILMVAAGISWFGVLVFQCDSNLQRIRFLADRGISPRVVWFSRQIIPFASLGLFLLACGMAASMSIGLSIETLFGFGLVFAGLAALATISYLAAQWLGQVISSPILAAILAPPISILAIVFNYVCITLFETPVWFLAMVNLIPLMVTCQLTRRWMDRRLGWGYGLRHACGLACYVVLPMIPLGLALLRTPSMPAKIAEEMESTRLAMEISSSQRLSELVLATDRRSQSSAENWGGAPEGDESEAVTAESPSASNRESLADVHRGLIRDISERLQETDDPVSSASFRVSDFLMPHAELMWRRLEAGRSPDTSGDSNASQLLEDYRQAVALVGEISKRLRKSWRIKEQDLADHHEIWLLRQLKRDDARQLIGEQLYEHLLQQIGNSSNRRRQRQAAIVGSWLAYKSERFPTDLGGYSLPDSRRRFSAGNSWLSQRRMGAAVADLWVLAGSQPSAVDKELLKRIAEFWGRPDESYGMGVSGPSLRADRLDQYTLTNAEGSGYLRSPARQWSAGWEREAEQLRRDMN
jgi:ABC-type transport system involved in multi-copper enzyme maturation permease subunit